MKKLNAFAVNLFPAFAVLSVVVGIRGECPPEVVFLTVIGTYLFSLLLKDKLYRWQATVAFGVFFALSLAYIYHARDIRDWVRVLCAYLGLMAIGFGWNRFRVKHWNVFAVFLFIALMVDLGIGVRAVSGLFLAEVEPQFQFHPHRVTTYSPSGVLTPLIGYQSLRFPELLRSEMNLLGSRFLPCQKQDATDMKVCAQQFSQFSWDIWTIFFVTRKYGEIFGQDGRWTTLNSELKQSYIQGTENLPELRFREQPICSASGYFTVDTINASEMHVTAAVNQPQEFVLPVIVASGLRAEVEVEVEGSAAISTTAENLFKIKVESNFGQVSIKPPRYWAWMIWAFWSPLLLAVGATLISILRRRA